MGRARAFTTVHRLPLVGGVLCLDFTNTTGARTAARPRERLLTYPDLLVWARRVGLIGAGEERRLRGLAATRPRKAAAALARARRLREDLYLLFRHVLERGRPERGALTTLERRWRRARAHRALGWGSRGLEVRRAGTPALDFLLGPAVDSAVELLASGRLGRLKRCEECDWLFLDESRSGSRRWCKDTCGTRVRARRLYAATKGGTRAATA